MRPEIALGIAAVVLALVGIVIGIPSVVIGWPAIKGMRRDMLAKRKRNKLQRELRSLERWLEVIMRDYVLCASLRESPGELEMYIGSRVCSFFTRDCLPICLLVLLIAQLHLRVNLLPASLVGALITFWVVSGILIAAFRVKRLKEFLEYLLGFNKAKDGIVAQIAKVEKRIAECEAVLEKDQQL